MFKLEQLESREVPTTFADIQPFFDQTVYIRPMPDVPADRILVTGVQTPDGPSDVFVATGEGNAVRVAIKSPGISGEIVSDFFAFPPDFRGGGKSVVAIGHEVFISPGNGGGAVIFAVNVVTGESRTFALPGFDESWRSGIKLTSADVDEPFGFTEAVSDDPGHELLAMAASAGAGPVVAFMRTDGTQALPPILVGPIEFRGELEFVAVSAGVQLPNGKIGFAVQPVGQTIDSTGHVAETWSYAFDGTLAPSDHVFPNEFNYAPIAV